jgi:phage tail sheath protein FI
VQTPLTPGVYYERVDASAPGISALRTDIAGFVGIARRGPVDTPVPVKSWRQFQAYFGDFTGAGYLAYAVRGFFENGGRKCWGARVGSNMTTTARAILQDGTNHDIWRISAFSPGVWGNDLEISLKETHRAQTLTVASHSTLEYSVVASTAGFRRGTHVRLRQGSTPPIHKIVSDIDSGEKNPGGEKRLIWVHPQRDARIHIWASEEEPKIWHKYEDASLTGLDLTQPLLIESVEYTLLVRELGRLVRVYEGLSLIPDNERYGPRVLKALKIEKNVGEPRVLPAGPEPIVIEELRENLELTSTLVDPIDFSLESSALTGGADGLALLRVYDFIGEEIDPFDSDPVKKQKNRGLRTLEDVSEVAIVAVPDIHIQPIAIPPKAPLPPCIPDPCLPSPPPAVKPREPSVGDLPPIFTEQDIFQVQSALVQQCEKLRDRIALLDPPYFASRDDKLGVGAARSWRGRFDSKYAAFYYPWLRVVDPLRATVSLTRDIPPSGHVAGQYAQTDVEVGVHKAPANAALAWIQDVTVAINDAMHGVLNPVGVNAIRPLPGRGIRIFGARTVSSDPDWRFVNVRRLLMMIEKAIDVSIQWAVFEPNNGLTRAKLRLALTSFLLTLWQKGALMGHAANEAFFVRCDETNNPARERDNGRLLAEVGVAASQPFEFVILRVGRTNNEFEITESSSTIVPEGIF